MTSYELTDNDHNQIRRLLNLTLRRIVRILRRLEQRRTGQ